MKLEACVGLFREPQPSRAEGTRPVSPIRPVPTDNNHDDGWPESHEGQQAKAYWVRIGIAGKQYHRQQGRNADSEQGQPGPEQSAYSHSLLGFCAVHDVGAFNAVRNLARGDIGIRKRPSLDELHYRDPPASLRRMPVYRREPKLPTFHFDAQLIGVNPHSLSDHARPQPRCVSGCCLPADAIVESNQALIG